MTTAAENTPILTVHAPTLSNARLTCTYSVNGEDFVNSYEFPEPINDDILRDPTTIKLCELASVTTGFGLFSVDYFENVICDFYLTKNELQFFEKLIYLGFGEFRFVNKIPLDTRTTVQCAEQHSQPILISHRVHHEGSLLLNGGGKDGSVSAWLLNSCNMPFTWFQRGDSAAQSGVRKAWGAPSLVIHRNLDPNRANRKYSGHRPMSAGIAFIALLTAHVYRYRDVIASNETSANEGNATIDGFVLNHQYSKSLEFEQDLQHLLRSAAIDVRYFSLLRSLHELQIGILASNLEDTQLASIVSCNNGTKKGYWCLHCAKCAFVSLVLTAVDPGVAQKIWGKRDIINTPELQSYLSELVDPDVIKPLECVGTLAECQLAAGMIIKADQQKPFLTNNVRRILEKHAAQVDDAIIKRFIESLAPSSIPIEYARVGALMETYLKNFR